MKKAPGGYPRGASSFEPLPLEVFRDAEPRNLQAVAAHSEAAVFAKGRFDAVRELRSRAEAGADAEAERRGVPPRGKGSRAAAFAGRRHRLSHRRSAFGEQRDAMSGEPHTADCAKRQQRTAPREA